MSIPHILMIPFPGAQGHAIPMMELAQTLAKQSFKITIVNTKHGHHLVAGDNYKSILGENIHLVPLPEHSEQDSSGAVAHSMHTMPGIIEKLIEKLNGSAPEGEKISCIIGDQNLGWAMEIGKKMGLKRAAFLPSAATMLVMGSTIPRLIDEGVIDEDGTPTKNQVIQISPTMPCLNIFDFLWTRFHNMKARKFVFEMVRRNNRDTKLADWVVCNSAQNLEPGAFASAPEVLPIGPLLPSNRKFYPDDSNCLKWLDEHQPNSVIYAAFGSTSVFSHTQFKEIALGLEVTHKPFLWVVRPGMVNDSKDVYPEGFLERVASRAKFVEFAPQKEVLNHPSIACFVSHCGWNSTIEGVSGGVPFLCWPYFADQFANQSYICDVWKVGLRIEKNESGIVTREGIKSKVEQLLADATFRERALGLQKETINSIKEGGSSFKNRNNFVEWIKA